MRIEYPVKFSTERVYLIFYRCSSPELIGSKFTCVHGLSKYTKPIQIKHYKGKLYAVQLLVKVAIDRVEREGGPPRDITSRRWPLGDQVFSGSSSAVDSVGPSLFLRSYHWS